MHCLFYDRIHNTRNVYQKLKIGYIGTFEKIENILFEQIPNTYSILCFTQF